MKQRAICKWIFLSFLLLIASCQMGQEKDRNAKGASIPMETYYIGRFSIGVPVEMKQHGRSQKLRYFEFQETTWPKNKKSEDARKEAWDTFLNKIKILEPPKGADKVIINTRDFPNLGEGSKGIFFHNSNDAKDEGTWNVLIDTGNAGLWLKGDPTLVEKETKNEKMAKNIDAIGKSYLVIDLNAPRPRGDWFYLQHGAINLPYRSQESTYVRFEGHPLKFTIEVKMNETYKVEPGINERTSSEDSKLMARVLGVSVDRIRTGKRKVAGLEGEEELDRVSDKKGKKLSFDWEYPGEENSGVHPRILISMESPDGSLEEKLKIWDAVLNSMQPMYK